MTTTFQLHYRKHKYTPEKIDAALLYDIQNYIPIYSRFFDINETNYNSIQLNQKYYLHNIIEHPTQILTNNPNRTSEEDNDVDGYKSSHTSLNHLETVIGDDAGNTTNVPVFVKYSPLLDPIRYLSGKYETSSGLSKAIGAILPKYNSTLDNCDEKILNTNNSSYVDGFFSYLTSKTLHTHGIVHGLDYYGSYLCKQREFSTNVFDDIDYLADCSFFNTYENERFFIDYSQFGEDDTNISANKLLKLKNKLNPIMNCNNETNNGLLSNDYFSKKDHIDILEDVSICDTAHIITSETTDKAVSVCQDIQSLDVVEINMDDFDTHHQRTNECQLDISTTLHPKNNTRDNEDSDSDTSQSNSSYTTMDESDCDSECHNNDENSKCEKDKTTESTHHTYDDDTYDNTSDERSTYSDDDGDSDDGDGDDDGDDDDDEKIIVKIKDFPVQAILLEKCVNTLDHIMMHDELTKEEWASILFQVIMTLIIYQKMFAFTHNDLHTNNIMFIETTEEFIYYLYDGQYYKVPTYGRIFKIIDFGRAIYKFHGELICSDSFHPKGDAATQYNFPPYYNPEKTIVEPNYSFDLCRFACALFDYFIYDIKKVDKLCKSDPIIKLVVKWTMDDKGRNVLYKSSGEERYPDFKLYKMISRSVHNHIPSNEIHNPVFEPYKITLKKYKKHAALAAKFLNNGKNTHIFINVDTLPCYC